MAAILCDSIFVVVAVVARTRSRAIPLAMIIMRKFIHGLPFLFYMSMGPHMTALRATVALLSLLDILNSFTVNNVSNFSFFRLYLYCVPKLVWDFPSLQGMDTLIEFLSISKYSFDTSSVTCVDFFDFFGVYIIHFISKVRSLDKIFVAVLPYSPSHRNLKYPLLYGKVALREIRAF